MYHITRQFNFSGERVLAEVDVVLPPSMPLDAAHDVGEKLQVGGRRAVHPVLLGRPTDPPDRLCLFVLNPLTPCARTYERSAGGSHDQTNQP